MTSVRFGKLGLLFCALALLTHCQLGSTSGLPPLPANTSAAIYRLGPSDRLKVTVFGFAELSGEYAVNQDGQVTMPFVEPITALNLTIPELKQRVTDALAGKGYKEPNVSVDIIAYRPFYIMGEVAKPGPYPYMTNTTMLRAVAEAAGYTYRADEDVLIVQRRSGDGFATFRANPTDLVAPDDIIRVPERHF